MAATARETQKNQEAESAYVRKNLWGVGESKQEEDDMGTTILGDITHPAPIVITQPQQPQNSLLPIALAAMAAIGIPATLGVGALAGYMLTKQPAQTFQDETVSIGLGKIEYYTSASSDK